MFKWALMPRLQMRCLCMPTTRFFEWLNGIEKQKSESIIQLNVKGPVESKSVAAMWREALILNRHRQGLKAGKNFQPVATQRKPAVAAHEPVISGSM